MMRKLLISLALMLLFDTAYGAGPQIIPTPVSYTPQSGVCMNPDNVKVEIGMPGFMKDVLKMPYFMREEAYRLSIKATGVKIEALTQTGAFRAKTTLEQLKAAGGQIPCCTIFDYPRFRHRGMMIDESRSFKGLEFLKKQVDAMALLKLNVLHLHLTDAAGWRIEVPGYPVLTDSVAWRIGKSYFDWEKAGYPFASARTPRHTAAITPLMN